MRKITGILSLLLLTTGACLAQSSLILKSGDRGLYIDHTVAPKEGMYAIGRLYNVNPKHVAAFNKVDMNKGLNIGDIIRIPLSDTNFSQETNSGAPVYIIAGEKDGLMSISNEAKKVSLRQLREWNNLSSDKITPGQKLIVGFLQSKELASATAKAPAAINKQNDEPKEKVKEESKPLVEKKSEVPLPVNKTPKEETKAVAQEAQQPKEEGKPTPVNEAGNAGYFKNSFEQQVKTTPARKNETVTAGIFKTTSGWEDAKYYLLIDKVTPGTIVRVINPGNNKAVYAKVLGEMNGIRQNQGLDIRISNAAASALGVNDPDKFIVKVNY